MGKTTGFLEHTRELPKTEDPKDRLQHFDEFIEEPSKKLVKDQSGRCMDCGVPFCHNGCPLGNIIPEFNDACYDENWEDAISILQSTNNFPEFTGRICPAPCEASCVLGINQPPVAIEFIEKTISEKAYELGLIKPNPPKERTGKKIAVIGSGPAGLACADQLNKAGHHVTVFERAQEVGGLLRYGIPDFKLSKKVVARRVKVMEDEGIEFKTGVHVGKDTTGDEILKQFDSVAICVGSTEPRDIPIKGRELNGVVPAMEFLSQQNSRVSKKEDIKNHRGDTVNDIFATGKRVVVIGGGDTGSDCVGTSNRHGAASVTQIELLERPPLDRSPQTPWPQWPHQLRTSSSHEEGVQREWALFTQEFVGDEDGNLKGLRVSEMGWSDPQPGKKPKWEVIEGTEKEIPCELALIAIGFVHPEHNGLLDEFGLEYDERGNVKDDGEYKTNKENVFTAGDARRGQSLVVWAISEGRECAYNIDKHLMGESSLPRKDEGKMSIVDE